METNDIYYENFKKYKNFKPIDLAMVHIFEGKENKPYRFNKRGHLDYLFIFKAVDKLGTVLHTVEAYNAQHARNLFESQIRKGTQKFNKWADYGYTIRYEPYSMAKRSIALKYLNEDESIKEPTKYFGDICERYNRYFK